MIKQQILVFILRWAISSAAMWLCITLFATVEDGFEHSFWLYAMAGLIFSLVNSFVKPLLRTFSLPLIILTLGIFNVLLSVAMVGLTIWLLPHVQIDFWGAALSALIISAISSLVNLLVPAYNNK